MNVLGVCNLFLEFIYVQPGWEGSAHDGRVLRDAISRPNGLKVPQGNYTRYDLKRLRSQLTNVMTFFCRMSRFLLPG